MPNEAGRVHQGDGTQQIVKWMAFRRLHGQPIDGRENIGCPIFRVKSLTGGISIAVLVDAAAYRPADVKPGIASRGVWATSINDVDRFIVF